MNSADRAILTDFKIKRNTYLELEDIVYNKISRIIKDNNIFVMEVSHRTKEVNSLEGKLHRKSGKYKSIYDITDLVGIRIICYFSDTIDTISKEIEKSFIVDLDNSVDKRKTLGISEFGYISVHYICSLFEEDCPDDNFKDIKFEFQLRSVLQHAWAEIEHDLGYKTSYGIPQAIRRDFSRVAGLLEIADREFLELRNNVHAYEDMVNTKITTNNGDDISLDRISLNSYIHLNTDFNKFVERLKTELSVTIEFINPDSYLEQFAFFGVETIGDLCKMFEDNKELLFKIIHNQIASYELDIMTSNMILRYLCRAELINKGYSKPLIERFLGITTADQAKIARRTEQILAVINENLSE